MQIEAGRNPKAEILKKAEIRKDEAFDFRNSDLGFPSAFGFRPSDFAS